MARTRNLEAALCLPLCLAASLGACDRTESKPEPSTATATAATVATATASATASATAEAIDYGPSVSISAGTFKAGSRCNDVPRIRPHELEHEEVSLGAFQMDKYPYPNEVGKPAMINVSHEKATQLCAERGKRLCTELEWERACKGPKSTTYQWGNGYNNTKCKGQLDNMIGQRSECESDLGVVDLIGVALEWTSSDWERGTPTGDKVVRGSRAKKVSWLSARCTHARKRNPNLTFDNVGFRCCSGPINTAKVVMRQKKLPTIEQETGIDTPFEMALMRAMPRNHRGITGVELSFDQVYRWHPVANEELIVARWKGKPKDSPPFYEVVVFKLCGQRAHRVRGAKTRGPVGTLSKPKVGINARKLSFDVETDDKSGAVTLSYWHGTVKLKQPAWIKKGNQLKVKKLKPGFRFKRELDGTSTKSKPQ